MTHKTLSNEDGEYDQFVMFCQNPDCRAMYSFSVLKDAHDMLVESFKEEYRGWVLPISQSNDNGNGHSNERSSKQTSTRGSQSQSRTSRTSRQQEPEQAEESEESVPF